ncbi:MAG: hypothetical protein ACLTSZ_17005 [Lachnospiraceae bacterium]
MQSIKEEAAADVEARLTKKLQHLPVEAKELEELEAGDPAGIYACDEPHAVRPAR